MNRFTPEFNDFKVEDITDVDEDKKDDVIDKIMKSNNISPRNYNGISPRSLRRNAKKLINPDQNDTTESFDAYQIQEARDRFHKELQDARVNRDPARVSIHVDENDNENGNDYFNFRSSDVSMLRKSRKISKKKTRRRSSRSPAKSPARSPPKSRSKYSIHDYIMKESERMDTHTDDSALTLYDTETESEDSFSDSSEDDPGYVNIDDVIKQHRSKVFRVIPVRVNFGIDFAKFKKRKKFLIRLFNDMSTKYNNMANHALKHGCNLSEYTILINHANNENKALYKRVQYMYTAYINLRQYLDTCYYDNLILSGIKLLYYGIGFVLDKIFDLSTKGIIESITANINNHLPLIRGVMDSYRGEISIISSQSSIMSPVKRFIIFIIINIILLIVLSTIHKTIPSLATMIAKFNIPGVLNDYMDGKIEFMNLIKPFNEFLSNAQMGTDVIATATATTSATTSATATATATTTATSSSRTTSPQVSTTTTGTQAPQNNSSVKNLSNKIKTLNIDDNDL